MSVAIVTGAGSGIGRAVALRLAGDGYRVIVNDLRKDAAWGVAAEIGSNAIAVAGDVSVEAEVAHIVESCRQAFGSCTHLVNNAGHRAPGGLRRPRAGRVRPHVRRACARHLPDDPRRAARDARAPAPG